MLPLEDKAAGALLEPLPEAERFASWHLVRPGGSVTSRGAAGVDLLDALGFPQLAAAASRIERPIERLYGFVADHRDRLGHVAPKGPAPRRFP